jgi:hypothetical protein
VAIAVSLQSAGNAHSVDLPDPDGNVIDLTTYEL